MKASTILDVAALAQVSRQTVSNVLNAPDRVKPETRERVQAAIEALGYRPHSAARRLRLQKSLTIGIRLDPMADGISGSVLDQFLHAFTEQADARNLRVMLFTAIDPEDEIRQFRRLSEGADVDGFVLTSTFSGDPRTEWLIEAGIPFVTFGRPWGIDDLNDPRHPWVDVDGSAGVRSATEYLRGLGLAKVGYIGWPSPSGTGDDRRRGWADAMADADTAEGRRLSEVAKSRVAEGAAAMRRLLGRIPTLEAVVCASDSIAVGALLESGGRVPVIGFDNTPIAAALGFSSVEQPLEEVAAGVLDLLEGYSAHHDADEASPGRHRLIAPKLVVRSQSLRLADARSALLGHMPESDLLGAQPASPQSLGSTGSR